MIKVVNRLIRLVLVLAFLPAPLAAQLVPAPPTNSSVDERSVDLASGTVLASRQVISIGPSDHHGLQLSQQWVSNGWRYREVPTLSGNGTYPVVSFMGGTVPFRPNGSSHKPFFEDGSTLTLTVSTAEFVGADGTKINFNRFPSGNYGQYYFPADSGLGYPTKITYADGTVWSFNYKAASYTYAPAVPPECNVPSPPQGCEQYAATTYNYRRLASITSSTGYQIKLNYVSDTLSAGTATDWTALSNVKAINNAVEYCSPTEPCTLNSTWPTVTLSGGAVTDPEGRVTTYTYTAGQLTGIKLGTASNVIEYTYSSGKVATAKRFGQTWTYTYARDGVTGLDYTTVTDPAAHARRLDFNANDTVAKSTNELLQVAEFTYCDASAPLTCPEGLLKVAKAPGENTVSYLYDARGNVTKTTWTGKPDSGVDPIEVTATYPSSCTTSNQKVCNKPLTTTDARSQVTTYEYSADHGGAIKITMPADVDGVQPETRITYFPKQANYLTGATTYSTGTTVWVPTVVSSCRIAVVGDPDSCVGTADEQRASASYPASTTPNNLQPDSVIVKAGDGTLAATTAIEYDDYGRAVTVDGPLAADTSRVFYNLAGQVIGRVGPDPDDAGTSPYPAVKYTYNVDSGKLEQIETGTVAGPLVTDWAAFGAAFTATANTIISFDTYGRPVRRKIRNGATTYQAVDMVYDNGGRVLCTMVRMDNTTWGPIATSCAPSQTIGPQGADRVTYNTYDELGRVTKVTTGYGVTGVAADEVTSTFTTNGQLQTVTDAEGNKTTYEYDGHDRLVRARYPDPAIKGTSSDTDDELIGYYSGTTLVSGYDGNGNVTDFTTRAGERLRITYDNLNRMTKKAVPNRAGNWCGTEPAQECNTHTRDIYFAYDLFGNMMSAKFGTEGNEALVSADGVVNAFDARSRLISATTSMGGTARELTYTYDKASNLTRITHPDTAIFFNYVRSDAGWLEQINRGTNPLVAFALDAQGRTDNVTRYDPTLAAWGAPVTFAYDALSRVASIATDPAGTTYDTTTSFSYNRAGQLSSRTQTNDQYAFTAHANQSFDYVANGLNQYTSVASTNFTYDGNGNLSGDGTHAYVYDVENRLVARSSSSTRADLRYDPLGRLFEVKGSDTGTTQFLYDDDDLVAEYDASGAVLRRYAHGMGAGDDALVWFEGSTVSNTARHYLYADERGSIVAVTNSAGTVNYINSYDEYGVPDSAGNDIATRGRFRYTGQAYIPELGMYYYKARMYSPALGRFMHADPIGYGDGMNMYTYVGGDPINRTDPTGLEDILVTHPLCGGAVQADSCSNNPASVPLGSSTFYGGYNYNPLPPLPCNPMVEGGCSGWGVQPHEDLPPNEQPQPRQLDLCGSPGNSQYVPEGIGATSFQGACYKHDQCYATLGNSQEQCDQQLGQNILDECKIRGGMFCAMAAYAYYKVLSVTGLGLGTDAYNNAQQEALLRRISPPRSR